MSFPPSTSPVLPRPLFRDARAYYNFETTAASLTSPSQILPPCNTGGVSENFSSDTPSVEPISEALSVDSQIRDSSGQDLTAFPAKTCGHAWSFGDPEGGCYECEIESGPKETSRARLDRRRKQAAAILKGQSPAHTAHKDQKRGRWYPVSACCIVPIEPELHLSQRASGRVVRSHVMTCGSVWTCPTCAQRIAVLRAAEVASVVGAARDAGYRVVMITFTLPHDFVTPLQVSLDRLANAMAKFVAAGGFKRKMADLGYLGFVGSLEITRGLPRIDKNGKPTRGNGWNGHYHRIFVFETVIGETTIKQDNEWCNKLKKSIFPYWQKAAENAGCPRLPSFRHGLNIRPVWSDTDYIIKTPELPASAAEKAKAKAEEGKPRWGVEAEITKAYMKEGGKHSCTPFELLDRNDEEAIQLFRKFAKATFGRHQIEWSKGDRNLRKIFFPECASLSDEEAAAAEPDWIFADEIDEPDQSLIITEKVSISRKDAWLARRFGKSAIDSACAAAQTHQADYRLSEALEAFGFKLERIANFGTYRDMVRQDDGIFKEVTQFRPDTYVASWGGVR